jgi:hypothetical protein
MMMCSSKPMLNKGGLLPDCTFTSVTSDESKFLEDFMTFASDFGGRTPTSERASLTELTVCDRTGQLTRPAAPDAACTVTSLASLPGQYGSGTYGQHQHRDKYPGKKRLHSHPPFGESSYYTVFFLSQSILLGGGGAVINCKLLIN